MAPFWTELGSLSDLGSLPFWIWVRCWIWVHCRICWIWVRYHFGSGFAAKSVRCRFGSGLVAGSRFASVLDLGLLSDLLGLLPDLFDAILDLGLLLDLLDLGSMFFWV